MLGLMNDQTHHIMTKKKKKGGDTVMTFWEPILNTVILIFLF